MAGYVEVKVTGVTLAAVERKVTKQAHVEVAPSRKLLFYFFFVILKRIPRGCYLQKMDFV